MGWEEKFKIKAKLSPAKARAELGNICLSFYVGSWSPDRRGQILSLVPGGAAGVGLDPTILSQARSQEECGEEESESSHYASRPWSYHSAASVPGRWWGGGDVRSHGTSVK